jgi:hypothetical protein
MWSDQEGNSRRLPEAMTHFGFLMDKNEYYDPQRESSAKPETKVAGEVHTPAGATAFSILLLTETWMPSGFFLEKKPP